MGIQEIVLLVGARAVAQAVAVYLAGIQGSVTSPFATAAVAVGKQIAVNVVTGCTAGLVAANAEFDATNKQEKIAAAALNAIPPIT